SDLRNERGHLSIEAENAPVNHRDVLEDARIVDEIARREVVDAVDDYVPTFVEDAIDVLARESLLILDDVDVRVEPLERYFRAVDLGHAQAVRGEIGRAHV